MEITKVRYYDISEDKDKPFICRCSVVLEDCVIIHDIRILRGNKGRYLVMPEKSGVTNNDNPSKNGEKEDVFHPVRKSYLLYMKEVILGGLSEYENGGNIVYYPYRR